MVLVLFLIQTFWPVSADHFFIHSQYSWMVMHWGSPLAFTILRGALRLMNVFRHIQILSDWAQFSAFRDWFESLKMMNGPFFFWLKMTALTIWIGFLFAMMSLFFLAFRLFYIGKILHFVGINMNEAQPWEQAQRWSIWRRSLGLIPLLTLFWAWMGALGWAPFFGVLWVGIAHALWWPFFAFRKR